MLMQVPYLIKSVPNHSDGDPGQRTSPSTSAWMMCWTSACLLRTPPHTSLGLARPTCTDYTNGLPCPLPLNPAYGEPGRRSKRGTAMPSRPQLFPSGVTDQTADLGVPTQPSVLGFGNCTLPSPIQVQLLLTPGHHVLPGHFSALVHDLRHNLSTKLSNVISI